MLRLNKIYRHEEDRYYNASLMALGVLVVLIVFQAVAFFQIGYYFAIGIFAFSLAALSYLHLAKGVRKNLFVVDFKHLGFLLALGMSMVVLAIVV